MSDDYISAPAPSIEVSMTSQVRTDWRVVAESSLPEQQSHVCHTSRAVTQKARVSDRLNRHLGRSPACLLGHTSRAATQGERAANGLVRVCRLAYRALRPFPLRMPGRGTSRRRTSLETAPIIDIALTHSSTSSPPTSHSSTSARVYQVEGPGRRRSMTDHAVGGGRRAPGY
jgi:hypothetical protein